jgi:ABC-type antimicrobial peptide transport system permease subunit
VNGRVGIYSRLVFATVGAIASWLPACRVARADLIIAMRSD